MRKILAGAALVAIVAGACGSADGGDDLKYGAFDVCTQFVKERLRAQSTAEFPNPYEDDGEVVWSNVGARWKVRSQVDAENGFGGTVTTRFVCAVEHHANDRWTLSSLDFLE
jgi:hypothetical protein